MQPSISSSKSVQLEQEPNTKIFRSIFVLGSCSNWTRQTKQPRGSQPVIFKCCSSVFYRGYEYYWRLIKLSTTVYPTSSVPWLSKSSNPLRFNMPFSVHRKTKNWKIVKEALKSSFVAFVKWRNSKTTQVPPQYWFYLRYMKKFHYWATTERKKIGPKSASPRK